MTNNNASAAAEFVAVRGFTMDAKSVLGEERWNKFPKPEVFNFEGEKSNWKRDPSKAFGRDELKLHGMDPSRPCASMVSVPPNVENFAIGKSPYFEVKEDVTPDTSATWKPYQSVPFQVFQTMKKSKKPMTAAELAAEVSKALPEVAKLKWFDLTVSDTLRDMTLYGVAERDSAKHNAKRTKYRLTDPKAFKLLKSEGK